MKKNLTVRIGAIVMVLMVALFSILPDLVNAEGDDTKEQTDIASAESSSEAGSLDDDGSLQEESAEEGGMESAGTGSEETAPEIPDGTVTDGGETEPEIPDTEETGNLGEEVQPEEPTESTEPAESTESTEEMPDGGTQDTDEEKNPDANTPSEEGSDMNETPVQGGTDNPAEPAQPEDGQTGEAGTGADPGAMDTIEDYVDILSKMELQDDKSSDRLKKLGAEMDLEAYADLFDSDESDFVISEDGTTVLGYKDTAPGGVVKIPDKITAIGDGAFMGKTIITGIIFPPNLQSIGSSAFNGCSNISAVSIPDTVTSVGAAAFANCTGLAEVYTGAGTGEVAANEFSNCVSLQSVAIPEGTSSIASGAFESCSNLGSISLPSTLASFDRSAFAGDVNLASISVASGSYSSYDGCVYTADGGQLLLCPQGKTGISFSSGMRSVASGAFSGCNYLLSAVIPEAASTIEANAFSGSAIKSVTIPTGVTAIGSQSGWAPNVVYGYRGSTAETWARQSNYVFESLDGTSGGGGSGEEEHIEDPDPTNTNNGGGGNAAPGTSTPRVNLGSSGTGNGTTAVISRNARGYVSSTPKTGVEDYGIYFLFGGIFLIGIAFLAYSRKMRLTSTK